ncbi:aromatic ring-hydroxylating oxygenase subunit alpha [Sphingopyxis sp. Root214]|uniref:aromatic ring-hydroxylating oxygenase subunit alpha n=2 Tax=unclassified Sphingopyxis TaxID=2614943 RepID=UPI0006FBE2AD|nr:SRPBCC family protein [Sphingopyxis sp. Root214]
MQAALMDRIKQEILWEIEREGLPDGFPQLPDIPAGRYTSQIFYDLEQQHMWPKVWLYAGRAEQLPRPGDFQLWDYSGPPILLVRDTAGALRAFLNQSPNDAPLVPYADDSGLLNEMPFDAPGRMFMQVDFPARQLPGGRLQCQRKGWTYDLDGRLVAVPDGQIVDSIPHRDRQLIEYRCEVWGGFIFVNRDKAATPLIEWLGPVAEQMEQYRCENLRMFSRATVLLRTNWKVAVEAFQEVYHFKHIHHHEGVVSLDQRGVTHTLFPHGHSRMVTPFAKRQQTVMGMSGPTDWESAADAARDSLIGTGTPIIETVAPIVNGAVLTYSLFPNATTPTSARGLPMLAAWPVDPSHTFFEWTSFVPDWGEDTPAIEAMRKAVLTTPMQIMEEDVRNMEPMFMSLSSPGLPGLHLGYNERRLYNSAEVLDQLIGIDNIPGTLRVEQLLERYVVDQ